MPLRRWVRRAYFRTALAPLLMVEVVIVAIYLWANQSSTWENQQAVRALANGELEGIAAREAASIDKQLQAIAQTTDMFRMMAGQALVTPFEPDPEERARYAYSADGVVYYTMYDNGGSALFYSGVVPVGPGQREKALRTAQLDPLMRAIDESHPLVVQLYMNTFDSMSRLYPFFDVLAQLPTRMDIPTYNFFYEADAQHNPDRGVVWTDVYVDPAGKGWMLSAIAPVYRNDKLEAVVGLDITVETMVESILGLAIPWQGYGVLIGKDGTILALPRAGEADLGLEELTQHRYTEQIFQDTFKPDAFNVYKRPELAELVARMGKQASGITPVHLEGSKLAAWATIPQTGWKLLILVPEANIYAQAIELGDKMLRIGALMIGGILVFYTVFLLFLDRQARRMARSISQPLEEMDTLVQRIGKGDYEQAAPSFPVSELQATASGLVDMGRQLGVGDRRLREARAEAEEARDQALEASRLKSEFLASVSHEIRTPMNGILGMLDLLLETPLQVEQRQFAIAARDSGQSLLTVINDILDFSKIEAGKLDLSNEVFSPEALLEGAADILAPRAHQKRLELMTFADPRVPAAVSGDPGRLRQVLLNLIGNAIKFTEPGGEIVVRVVPEVAPGAAPDAAPDTTGAEHAMLRFTVTDTGIGIAPAAHKRLFQPFTQVDGSAARRHGGTGLGLSISKRLIELMGGEIGVDSREGVGSTFWFRVPLAPAQAAGRRTGPQALARLAGMRALIIDRRSSSRGILEAYLQSQGLIVTGVATVHEGLTVLRAGQSGDEQGRVGKPFDCMLVSLELGGVDDRALASGLEHEPVLAAIPRLLLADFDEKDLVLRARAHGYAASLTKPLHRSRLFDALVELRGKRARSGGDESGAVVAAPPAPETPAVRILLAEDNEVNQLVAIHRLRKLGYQVDVVINGREAVDRVRERFYELILMDIQMPIMDGIEATREIRAAQAALGQHSIIVAVTANAMSGDRERFLSMGMDDYISKPYQARDLQNLVDRWLTANEQQAKS